MASDKYGPKVADAHAKIHANMEGAIKQYESGSKRGLAAMRKAFKQRPIKVPIEFNGSEVSQQAAKAAKQAALAAKQAAKSIKQQQEKENEQYRNQETQKEKSEVVEQQNYRYQKVRQTNAKNLTAYKSSAKAVTAVMKTAWKTISHVITSTVKAAVATIKGTFRSISTIGRTAGRAFSNSFSQAVKYRMVGLGRYIRNFLLTAFVFVGINKAISQFKEAVGASSDFEQNIAAAGVIFEGQEERINKWASSMSNIGISTNAAIDSLKTFGVYAEAAGKTGDDALNFSQNLVEMSADMGAFFNTTSDEALVALQAGLRGEYLPLRRYGVLLSEQIVKQKAIADGLVTEKEIAGETLDVKTRMLAVNALIQEQSSKVIGQAKRESDTFYGVQQATVAGWKNALIDIGNVLQPFAKKVMMVLRDTVIPQITLVAQALEGVFDPILKSEGWDTLSEWIIEKLDPEKIREFMDNLVSFFMTIDDRWNKFTTDFEPLITVFKQFGETFKEFFENYHWSTTVDMLNQIVQLIITLSEPVEILLQSIMDVVKYLTKLFDTTLMPLIKEVVYVFATELSQNAGAIGQVFEEVITFVAELLPPILEILKAVIEAGLQLFTTLQPLITTLIEILAPALEHIMQVVVDVINALNPVIQSAMPFINDVIDTILMIADMIAPAIEALQPSFASMFEILSMILNEVIVPILESPLMDILINGLTYFGQYVGTIAENIGYLFDVFSQVNEVMEPLHKPMAEILDAFLQINYQSLGNMFTAFAHLFGEVLIAALPLIEAYVNAILPFVEKIADFMVKIAEISQVVTDGMSKGTNKLHEMFSSLKPVVEFIADIFEFMLHDFLLGIDNILTILGKMWSIGPKFAEFFTGLFISVADFFTGVLSTIFNYINIIIDAINKIKIDFPDEINFLGVKDFNGFNIPNISVPQAANGGLIEARKGGTLVNVAEKGKNEIIVGEGEYNRKLKTDAIKDNKIIELLNKQTDTDPSMVFNFNGTVIGEEKWFKSYLKKFGDEINKGQYNSSRRSSQIS